MRLAPLIAALCVPLWALPATADPLVDHVVDEVAIPRFDAFAAATADLAKAAAADCRAEGLRPAWNAAFDAWLPAQAFRKGPVEDGRALAIAYWPDPKEARDRTLRQLLAGDGASFASAAAYGQGSAAARGLYALESMLYDPDLDGYGPGDPGCALTRAAAGDLAATAASVEADWRADYGPMLKTAGAPGNTRFLSAHEARQALFTELMTQLAFDADTRLERPLGTIDRPRPTRAESRLSGRSQRNVALSLMANRELAEALNPGESEDMKSYWDYALKVAKGLEGDPVFAGVDTPSGRLKVKELKTAIERLHDAADAEIAPALGVTAGFNALDGD